MKQWGAAWLDLHASFLKNCLQSPHECKTRQLRSLYEKLLAALDFLLVASITLVITASRAVQSCRSVQYIGGREGERERERERESESESESESERESGLRVCARAQGTGGTPLCPFPRRESERKRESERERERESLSPSHFGSSRSPRPPLEGGALDNGPWPCETVVSPSLGVDGCPA